MTDGVRNICERLRIEAGVSHGDGAEQSLEWRAADAIEELCTALARLRALDLAALAPEPGVSCDADEHDAALEAAGTLVAKYQPKGDER